MTSPTQTDGQPVQPSLLMVMNIAGQALAIVLCYTVIGNND